MPHHVVKRRRGARPRIDWDAAFAYFCSDPTISFGAVGRKFGVSDVAVGKHAHADHWDDRRDEIYAKAKVGLIEDGVLKPLVERNRETLLLIRKGVRQLDSSNDAPKWSDLPGLVKLEQLLEGEATDRISAGEAAQLALGLVRGYDQLVTGLVNELVASAKRRVFVEAWRAGASAVLDEASAGLPMLEPGDGEAAA